jgi:hypothetical protein
MKNKQTLFFGLTISNIILLISITKSEILDLKKIAESVSFPSESLVLEDYTDVEKLIYATKMPFEQQTPFPPENIYVAYKITSNIQNSFHPIIITIVKKDSYLTESVKKNISLIDKLPEKNLQEGGRLPFGNFKISKEFSGYLYHEEMRVPAKLTPIPGQSPAVISDVPMTQPCILSFISFPSSKIDVRIAKYNNFSLPQDLVKVPRGEKYYAMFNDAEILDDPNDLPKEPMEKAVVDLFRTLNLTVINSQLLAPYLNVADSTEKPRAAFDDILTKEKQKAEKIEVSTETKRQEKLPAPQPAPAPLRQPPNAADSPIALIIIILVLLVLAVLMAILIKSRKT